MPPSSGLRDTILDVITEEKREMYMNVYDEIKAEGKAEGKAAGLLEALLQLLAHRGLVQRADEIRARVTACTDEAQAQRWFDRALTATTLAAVFDDT